LQTHPLRGAIFEGMVVTELIKKRTNAGLPINLFYWRDKTGHEIDIIIDNAGKLLPIEIKSGKTINTEFFKNMDYWSDLSKVKKSMVLYAGAQNQKRSNGRETLNWRSLMTQDF
jgi:predicted AAA+ superfamily ATPase